MSELLGHSGTAITRDTYTSVYTQLKRSAVDAVAAAIAQARNGPDQAVEEHCDAA